MNRRWRSLLRSVGSLLKELAPYLAFTREVLAFVRALMNS